MDNVIKYTLSKPVLNVGYPCSGCIKDKKKNVKRPRLKKLKSAVLVVFFVLCGQVTDVAAQVELVEDGASKVGDTVYLEGVPLERIIDSDVVQVPIDPTDPDSALKSAVLIDYISDEKPEIAANEILESRTPNTQTFDNRDGTYTLRYYLSDVFVTDGLEWRYLDKKITTQESFDAAFELAPVETSFFQTLTANAATTSASAADDTRLHQSAPTTNYGTVDPNWIQSRDASRNLRVVMRVTLPSGTGEITDVKLWQYYVESTDGGGTADNINIYSLTQTGWVESEATWNNYTTAGSWSSAGGDYSPTVIDSMTLPTGAVGWKSLTLMGDEATNALTIEWEDELNLIQRFDNESQTETYAKFTSTEGVTASQRPYLEITYTTESEPEPEPEATTTVNDLIVDMPYTQELTMITAMSVVYGTTTGTATPLSVEYTYYHIPLIAWLIIAYLLMNSLWFIYAQVKNYDRRR